MSPARAGVMMFLEPLTAFAPPAVAAGTADHRYAISSASRTSCMLPVRHPRTEETRNAAAVDSTSHLVEKALRAEDCPLKPRAVDHIAAGAGRLTCRFGASRACLELLVAPESLGCRRGYHLDRRSRVAQRLRRRSNRGCPPIGRSSIIGLQATTTPHWSAGPRAAREHPKGRAIASQRARQ